MQIGPCSSSIWLRPLEKIYPVVIISLEKIYILKQVEVIVLNSSFLLRWTPLQLAVKDTNSKTTVSAWRGGGGLHCSRYMF